MGEIARAAVQNGTQFGRGLLFLLNSISLPPCTVGCSNIHHSIMTIIRKGVVYIMPVQSTADKAGQTSWSEIVNSPYSFAVSTFTTKGYPCNRAEGTAILVSVPGMGDRLGVTTCDVSSSPKGMYNTLYGMGMQVLVQVCWVVSWHLCWMLIQTLHGVTSDKYW